MRSGRSDAAELTPYELRNLVAHLEAADRENTVHRLLALETDAGTNFWFEAKEKGDAGGYVTDAQRAWRLVRLVVDARIGAGEPAREIALEVRYALLIASVRSAAGLVPMALLTAMVEKGVRSVEEVLADLSQIHGGPPGFQVVSSLAPYLPEPALNKQLRDVVLGLGSLGVSEDLRRRDALSALAPYLPPDLMAEAVRLARAIQSEQTRAEALAALAPRLPVQLHDEGVATAAEIQEPSLRIAAFAALGIPTSRESLRAALAENPKADKLHKVRAAILLAATLPPELLSEVLAATRTFGPNQAEVLTALAPRLPDDLLPEAVSIVLKIGEYDHPGKALAALAPRLSGAALRRARRGAARFHEPEDRIRALAELALRYPEGKKDQILDSSLRVAEQTNFGARRELSDVIVRLVELLPQRLLPRALALARKIKPDDGGVAVLVAVGARLAGPDRQTVLREALRDTRKIDDQEMRMAQDWTSDAVLAKLAPLLPGEVLPFVLEDMRPDNYLWEPLTARLRAIAPHLHTHELRQAQRAARELGDGKEQCEAVAALADYVHESDRSQLLRTSLDACRHIRGYWDRTMALHALAPKLSEDLGAEALDIAESIPDEPGARARAEAACSVPPRLLSRAVAAVIPGYEHWKAVAFAALATKAKEPTKTELFQQVLARVGEGDWDDRLAVGVDFIAQLALELPAPLLGEALNKALNAPVMYGDSGERSAALAALAPRFDEPERTAILEKALAAARSVNRDSYRVRALVDLGAGVPGVAEAIRQVSDAKWRAVGLAELGEPVPEEVWRVTIGNLSDMDNVEATLNLLPFASPDRVREALAELRESEEWSGKWFSTVLAKLVPRLGKDVLPDLVDLVSSMPPSSRLPVLAALVDTSRPFPQQRLQDCWAQARVALDEVRRSDVLMALAILAPIVNAVGGQAGVIESAASVHLAARWHP